MSHYIFETMNIQDLKILPVGQFQANVQLRLFSYLAPFLPLERHFSIQLFLEVNKPTFVPLEPNGSDYFEIKITPI